MNAKISLRTICHNINDIINLAKEKINGCVNIISTVQYSK